MLFSEYLGQWMGIYVVPLRKPRTVDCYRCTLRKLPPALLCVPLDQLDAMQLQAAINAQIADHPRTAQLLYSVLHCALARAVRLRLLAVSPMDAVDKPAHAARRAEVLTLDELRRYLAAARESDCWALLLLMATLGLRRGEALGLRWQDLRADSLHVVNQRIETTGAYQLAPLKTSTSDRWLRLPPEIALELTMIAHQSDFVRDTRPKHLSREHYKVLAAAQIEKHVTLHGLRHSAATIIARSGVPMKALQGILGHSTYKLTADLYADHMRGVEDSAAGLCLLSRQVFASDF